MNKIIINEFIHILEFPPTNKTILYNNIPTFINIPFYQQFVFNNYYANTYVNLSGSKNQFNEVDDAYTILLPNIQVNGVICHGINNLRCNNDSERLDFINHFWMSNFSYYIFSMIQLIFQQKLIYDHNEKPDKLYPVQLIKLKNY